MLKSACVAIAVLGIAHSAGAVTVETSQFLFSPTYFNGFENIASDSAFIAPQFFPSNTNYSEGGITVSYVNSSTNAIWTRYQYVGTNGWYPNGGGNGYTRVTLSNGGTFNALQFLAGTGYGSSTTHYEALKNGSVVSTGTIGPVVGSLGGADLKYYGLSGGGFDEVHLKSNFEGTFNPNSFEAGSFDSFAATANGAVPEPAQWLLMIGGFGLVGVALRRRPVQSVLA